MSVVSLVSTETGRDTVEKGETAVCGILTKTLVVPFLIIIPSYVGIITTVEILEIYLLKSH